MQQYLSNFLMHTACSGSSSKCIGGGSGSSKIFYWLDLYYGCFGHNCGRPPDVWGPYCHLPLGVPNLMGARRLPWYSVCTGSRVSSNGCACLAKGWPLVTVLFPSLDLITPEDFLCPTSCQCGYQVLLLLQVGFPKDQQWWTTTVVGDTSNDRERSTMADYMGQATAASDAGNSGRWKQWKTTEG